MGVGGTRQLETSVSVVLGKRALGFGSKALVISMAPTCEQGIFAPMQYYIEDVCPSS